jgi:protoporphyrinogen oxidase
MTTNYYDIIIIGGGMAGLYSAYNIKRSSPNTKILILEKNKKPFIGGRANNETFYGSNIVTGAGIGRKDTNPLLIKLCKQLGVDFSEHKSTMNYSNALIRRIDNTDIMSLVKILKQEYNKSPSTYNKLTFKQFATKVIGEKDYKSMVMMSGYTDYENADAYETLYNYGLDDTIGGWTMLYISWEKIVDKLVEYIGKQNILFSQNVTKIAKIDASQCLFKIDTYNGKHYYANKVIVATTIDSIINIVPGAKHKNSVYRQIRGQPFLRLYAKFSKQSATIMREYVTAYTVVTGPLQKIIPMNPENGVYMISYSDNKSAHYLEQHITNTEANRDFIARLTEKTLGIPSGELSIIALKGFYWQIGTHYYEPLTENHRSREEFVYEAQHPLTGVLVVGEAVSRYQGWVEGALESVNEVLTKKWINSKCG